MKFIVEKNRGRYLTLPTKVVRPEKARKALSPTSFRILREISRQPDYPKNLARKLGIDKQKVYYCIRNLKSAGLVSCVKEENRNGVTAKYYSAERPSISLVFREMDQSDSLGFAGVSESVSRFMDPFVKNGALNSLIIMGSPDPHGPNKARSRDGVYAIDIGLFIGRLISSVPSSTTMLDTQVSRSELKNNLIIIGGPGVNKIAALVNGKLPIRFVQGQKDHYSEIYSSVSKRRYYSDECGIVVKTRNPFDSSKQILFIAGRRACGTRTAITAFVEKIDSICAGNMKDRRVFAKVFEGVDSDSDGIIDTIEERE